MCLVNTNQQIGQWDRARQNSLCYCNSEARSVPSNLQPTCEGYAKIHKWQCNLNVASKTDSWGFCSFVWPTKLYKSTTATGINPQWKHRPGRGKGTWRLLETVQASAQQKVRASLPQPDSALLQGGGKSCRRKEEEGRLWEKKKRDAAESLRQLPTMQTWLLWAGCHSAVWGSIYKGDPGARCDRRSQSDIRWHWNPGPWHSHHRLSWLLVG